jgi:hypothetical protein
MASRANPGNSSHCRPNTKKSSNAVTKSTPHLIGGNGVVKAPMTSETPAIPKAKTSCLFEYLRAFDDGVSALVGCILGSGCGRFIVVSPLSGITWPAQWALPLMLYFEGLLLSPPFFGLLDPALSVLQQMHRTQKEHRRRSKAISGTNSKETNLQRL